MTISAYPKIFALGTRHISNLFNGPVEVTEKVDGSQFVFGKINGELYMRSRGKMIYTESVDSLFHEAVATVLSISHQIPDDMIFYCEYLKKPKHNCIAYERFPTKHLVLFGACDQHGNFESSHGELGSYANQMGIDLVPLLWYGQVNQEPISFVHGMLNMDSYLGGSKIEGVVIKRYGEFLIADQPRTVMAGKYVSESFKEKNQENFKHESSRNKVAEFFDSFRTVARWRKGVQHLAESGDLLQDPKDIGKILKEIHRDIEEEETDYIKEWLYQHFIKEIKRAACRGFAEWYKEYLMTGDQEGEKNGAS